MGDCFVPLLFACAFAVKHIAVGIGKHIHTNHARENSSIQLNRNLPQSNDTFLCMRRILSLVLDHDTCFYCEQIGLYISEFKSI